MATVDYRQAARKAAYLAIVITIIAVLPLINLNPHMDLRVLMVLDAPIFLLMGADEQLARLGLAGGRRVGTIHVGLAVDIRCLVNRIAI